MLKLMNNMFGRKPGCIEEHQVNIAVELDHSALQMINCQDQLVGTSICDFQELDIVGKADHSIPLVMKCYT